MDSFHQFTKFFRLCMRKIRRRDFFFYFSMKVFFRSAAEKIFQNLVQSQEAENHAVAGKRKVVISNQLRIIGL
ncbi:hypothetical protein C7I84_03210 [Mesorhizobium ephedrae]|uniref:Uncharacterized protein n=1 Tax=Kumtagia ephedrae TaxID=2116701 RepID=A0A2P7SQG6_9HYPH|nr:hypothetical protein C7I84_03210 [Mesorhizobium ephedrae]